MKKSGFGMHDQNISRIFELRRNLDHVFFKKFECEFPLPEEINFTHMKALLLAGLYEPVNMTTLAGYMQLEKGSFTPVAAKLIKLGFMDKIRDEQDKRSFNLKLTEKGDKLVHRFGRAHGEYINEKLKNLEPSEQKEFFSMLDRLAVMTGKMED